MRAATVSLVGVLVACGSAPTPAPELQPSLHVRQYLGRDDDGLAIPTREWLLGPWVVDVDSIELHLEEGEDPRPLLEELHRSVLVLEEDFFRFQNFVGPPYTVHAAGKLEIGQVDENGEVTLTFHPVGEEAQTDTASRWGLNLFLAPGFGWHVWRRPSSGTEWVQEREERLHERIDAWKARRRAEGTGIRALSDRP